jgi:hypothetical protein
LQQESQSSWESKIAPEIRHVNYLFSAPKLRIRWIHGATNGALGSVFTRLQKGKPAKEFRKACKVSHHRKNGNLPCRQIGAVFLDWLAQ